MPETWMTILPSSLYRIVSGLPKQIAARLEEIRVREGRPLEIVYEGRYGFLAGQGAVVDDPFRAYVPTREDCEKLLDLLTNHSMYTMEEQLKRGYITVNGGHRVGIAGRTVLEHGKVKQIKDISGFNIRVAREMIGAGQQVLPHIVDYRANSVHHTLVISPPRHGKTTMVRDLARLISYGMWPSPSRMKGGLKVGIVDERSELAACVKGVPRFDVGPRTDVLDNCPKAEGMMMMIRSMSPDVLIADEIGRPEDADAIHEALHAGIRVIATAHGYGMEDAARRTMLSRLVADGVFSRYVVLNKGQGERVVTAIYDAARRRIVPDAAAVGG